MATATCIRKFKQGPFLSAGPLFKRGVCYFICEYLETHGDSLWKGVANFAAAREAAMTMPLAGMMNYAKAKELRMADQNAGYQDTLPLKDDSLYRVELKVGDKLDHEVLALTGAGELMLFDPNAGIFHVTGIASGRHHTAIESKLVEIHGRNGQVNAVHYKRARKAFA